MNPSRLFSVIVLALTSSLFAEVSVQTLSDSDTNITARRDEISNESLIAHNSPALKKVETSILGEKFDVSKFNDGTLDATGTAFFKTLWVVFRLNTETAPDGYDISEIRVYSGSKELNATIFQNYDVHYHVIGAPEKTWDLLTESVKLDRSEPGVSEAKAFSRGQQTTIRDSSSKSLMQNVDAIKIDFSKRVLAFPDYGRFAEVADESGAASTNFQEIVVLGKPANQKSPEAAAAGLKLSVHADRKEALYAQGETVIFDISLEGGDVSSAGEESVQWKISKDGVGSLKSGAAKFTKGKAVVAASLAEPGFLLCEATYIHPLKGKMTALGGAGVDPLKIKSSMPAPDDFDDFWSAKKAELAAIPMNARLTPVNSVGKEPGTVELFDLQADCIGAPVSGYYARPAKAKPGTCPAILTVHGAGVYSASRERPADWASKGLIALDINAHGLPNGLSPSFYEEIAKGKLRDYATRNSESRDTVYFLGMYLRLVRAIDFLASQPEWDGRTLLVVGGSQGGAQAIAAAALDRRVSFICADVPAMCDHTGALMGRQRGWPKFLPETKEAAGKMQQVINSVRYYDSVNFASRVKVKSFFSTGFIDTVCAPTTVYAAYNNLSEDKDIYNDVNGGHRGTPSRWQASNQAINEYLSIMDQKKRVNN